MKKKMVTLLMAGMVVITLVGCKAKTSSSADSAQTAATQTQPAKEDEQPIAEKQEEETVQLEDKEEKVDVVDYEEQTAEEEVEIADNNEKKLDDLQDMLINYKDRVERTSGSYGTIVTLFRFSDINGDEYPELILMIEGEVITVLSYYNGDVWDAFDSSSHGGDWITSADEIRYNEGTSKIKAHKNVGNRYEENFEYEYVIQ